MIKMHSQRRSLSAALDMVEAAISSLENQATQAKLFEEQQRQQLLQSRLTPPLPITPDLPSAMEPIINYQLLNRPPIDDLQSHLPVTSDNEEVKLNHPETFTKRETKTKRSFKVVSSSPHKKHKSGKKLRSVLPGVLLQQRSSTPRKKSHRRSGSSTRTNGRQHSIRKRLSRSPVITERNNNSIIQPDDKEDPDNGNSDVKNNGDKEHGSGYLQPTLSSKRREQLTDKSKKKEKSSLPFVPVGSQGKSYHVGVIIQKELGKLKSQPLEVWAAAKHNAAKREAAAAP